MNNLKIFKDEPAFADSTVIDVDSFNHSAVSNVIFKVIKGNDPPFTLGLFGGWGIGKSSIINLLRQECKKEEKKYPYIYFNAWTSSEDSFRRQFLIQFAEQLISDEPKKITEIERLRKLNYAKSLEEEDGDTIKELIDNAREYGLLTKIKSMWNSAINNVKFSETGLITSILGLAFFVCAVILFVYGICSNDQELQRWGFLSFFLSAANFFAPKIENVLILKKREVFDAKLIFPEQFEKEYEKLLDNNTEKDQKVIIVIDDLDRCEPEVIKNVLVTLKNYLCNKKCIFIVPIDDSSVVRMFQNNNTNFGYEQLRKYFNVSIRIPTIHTEDLLDFAERNAKEYEIPPDVIFIAAQGHCTDARKMKHFLNLYKLKYALAEERESGGHLSYVRIKDIQTQIAKIVVLEYQYPEFYKFISNNPDELEPITNAAKNENYKSNKLKEMKSGTKIIEKIEDLWEENVGLKEFLAITYDISIDDFDILSKLKTTNQETELSELGICLRNAITKDTIVELEKFLTDKIFEEKGHCIVDTILKYYNDNFVRPTIRAINISINILSKNKLNNNSQEKLFKHLIRIISNSRIGYKINESSIGCFLTNFNIASHTQKKELTKKIEDDIFIKEKYIPDFTKIINHNAFKELLSFNISVSKNIATCLEEWYQLMKTIMEKQNFITTINKISLSMEDRIGLSFTFPSNKFLQKLIEEISTDPNDSNNAMNSEIFDLLINEKNPEDINSIATNIFDKVSQIIEANITDSGFNHLLSEALDFIDNCPIYPDQENAIKIKNSLIAHYSSFSNLRDKNKILFTLLYCFETLTSNKSENESLKVYCIKILKDSIPEQLKQILNLIEERFNDDSTVKMVLLPEIINTTWKLIISNVASDEDSYREKFKISYGYLKHISSEEQIALINEIIVSNDITALNKWKESIIKLCETFDEDKKIQAINLIEKVLYDVEFSEGIRELLGELYIDILKLISVQLGSENFRKLFLEFSGNDNFLINFLNSHWDFFINRYGNHIPQDNVNQIVKEIIAKDDSTINEFAINRSIEFVEKIKNETINKVSEKVIIDLPNDNLNFKHRENLLKLCFYTVKTFEKKNELSKVLFEYKESGNVDELKGESWRVYEHLTKNGIMKEYHPQKKDE